MTRFQLRNHKNQGAGVGRQRIGNQLLTPQGQQSGGYGIRLEAPLDPAPGWLGDLNMSLNLLASTSSAEEWGSADTPQRVIKRIR